MMLRRRVLKIVLAAVLVGDIGYFAWRVHEAATPNAAITYAGLDSLVLDVPRGQPAAILQEGKWYPDPATDARVQVPAQTQTGRPLQVMVIRVGSVRSYGSFIESLRSLRARHI